MAPGHACVVEANVSLHATPEHELPLLVACDLPPVNHNLQLRSQGQGVRLILEETLQGF